VMLAKIVEKTGLGEAHLVGLTDELLLEECRQHAVQLSDHGLLALLEALKWRRLYKRAFVHAADKALFTLWQNRGLLRPKSPKKLGLTPSMWAYTAVRKEC